MPRTLSRVAHAAAFMLLFPLAAAAQEGRISGTVADETGGVLPGVTVAAAAPELAGDIRVAVTGGDGGYAFEALPPGGYTLTFTLPGFEELTRTVELAPASAPTVDVRLRLGGLFEEVTVAVTNGLLTLGQTTGLTFTAGDGTSDATMTFTGSAADINAALDGLIYAPTGDYNGPATLTITTDDQGNNGSGGALTDTDTVAITVNAVNDAPINAVPGGQTTNEDTNLTFSTGNGNLISISDVDAYVQAQIDAQIDRVETPWFRYFLTYDPTEGLRGTRVPVLALFRDGGEWAVFVESDGRAELRHVSIGRQSSLDAEVLDGLTEGERVIMHPSDRVQHGVRVADRG